MRLRIILVVNEGLGVVDAWRLDGLVLGETTHSLLSQIVTCLTAGLLVVDHLF